MTEDKKTAPENPENVHAETAETPTAEQMQPEPKSGSAQAAQESDVAGPGAEKPDFSKPKASPPAKPSFRPSKKPDFSDARTKKILAGVIALLFLATVLWVAVSMRGPTVTGYETGSASVDELLRIESQFKDPGDVAFIASDSSPMYALIGTPLGAYYTGSTPTFHPLLVYQGKEDRYPYTSGSSAIGHFLNMYDPTNASLIVLGDPLYTELPGELVLPPFSGTPEEVSLDVAVHFWNYTDAVVLVNDDEKGYEEAVNAVPLASYLSIPVIVVDGGVDAHVADILSSLKVKYSIVCGDIGGFGKALHFKSYEEIEDAIIKVIRERVGGDINYIALANPMDVYPPRVKVVDGEPQELKFHFEGIIHDSSARAYPGAAPEGNDGPAFNFTIPYKYANVKIDVKMDVSEATGPTWSYGPLRDNVEHNADGSGERIYVFIGIDRNNDSVLDTSTESDELQFFGGSPGYDYIRANPRDPHSKPLWAHFYIELPFYNEEQPEHIIQLLGKLPTDPDTSAPFTVDITVQELEDTNYPLMFGLSSMAPYLAAYHKGVVLARPDFEMYSPGYIGCSGCGVPAANPEALWDANEEVKEVKKQLNRLLAKIAGMEPDPTALAEYYAQLAQDPETVMYVGIIADTNMVPMYFYPSNGQGDATEGFGIPSDICYMDVDADLDDPPYSVTGEDASFELAVGRVDGWDAQDVSALIARNVFYHRIIENYRGPKNTENPMESGHLAPFWKDSAITTVGSEPPIDSAYPTTTKLAAMYEAAGMSTNKKPYNLQNQMSRRQYSQPFYESANFIFFCAHGFYYWYVPTAQEGMAGITQPTYGGGAFDVTHVKDMTFGPSVIFGSSCVTGRIDGIPGRNALSQAFLHAGMNAYIGATRESWGSLVPIPDESSGESLGDLLALYIYADLTGYIYNKDGGMTEGWVYGNTSVGFALMDAKNRYIEHEGGSDNGGTVCDTFEEFVLHGDPAFNPYEPNHEGKQG